MIFGSREKWERERRLADLMRKGEILVDMLLERLTPQGGSPPSATDDVARVLAGLLNAVPRKSSEPEPVGGE